MLDRTMKIKICGITNLEDARFASGAYVDYLGFIFYPKSPRFVDSAKAGAMINWLEGPEKVGVFVNQPLDEVNQTAKESGIDIVQLHGEESPEYCDLVEKPVIKVIHITEDTTFNQIQEKVESYKSHVDYFLFDSKLENQWGGTGKAFNWNLLEKLKLDKPFFLSGGLNPNNLEEALNTVKPYAVDISSGVEEEPGLKDFEKIEAVMEILNKS